jgi:hypothetical protein
MKSRDFINRTDLFGEPVYGFNINGSQKIGSMAGLIGSFLAITLTLIYATIRLNILVKGHNPNISYAEEYDKFETANEVIDVTDFDFALAVLVQDYTT